MSSEINLESLLAKRGDESNFAYQMFLFFSRMSQTDRMSDFKKTIAEQFNSTVLTVNKYSIDFEWQSRMAKIDAFLTMSEIRNRQKQRKKDVDKIVSETIRAKQRLLNLAHLQIDNAEALCEFSAMANKETVVEEIEVYIKQGDNFTPKVLPIKTEIKMESSASIIPKFANSALGIIKTVSNLNIQDNTTVSDDLFTMDVKDLSDEELEQKRLELAKLKAIHEKIDEAPGVQ